jgi:hypothetical protein
MAAQEASREVPAVEVVLERVDHISRQRRGVRALRVRDEGGEVLADDAIEHGVVRPAGDIFCGRNEGRGGGHRAPSAPDVPNQFPLFLRRIAASGTGGTMAEGGGRHPSSNERPAQQGIAPDGLRPQVNARSLA